MVTLTLCWILTGILFMTTIGFLINASLEYGKKDDVKAANTIRIAIALMMMVLPIWLAYFTKNVSLSIYLRIMILSASYLLGWIVIGSWLDVNIKLLANDKPAKWCKIIDKTLWALILLAVSFVIFGPFIMTIVICVSSLIWLVVGSFKAAIKRRSRIS